MHKTPCSWVLALAMSAALGWAAPAQAQASLPAHADPADPKAGPTPLIYRSALQRYQPLQDTSLRDWRAANQRVHEAGGWRVYLRESQASAAAPAPTPTPLPADSKSAPAAKPAHQH
ncbi:hypothetical protein [Roseateles sp.]|jgi:hypothetical protein|uniref:hypothetical protein n=1 Tax=Roseateles sp. TaxID=1971397 RepID=UPI0037C5FF5F